MLRASTPGGHPLVSLAWLAAIASLVVGVWLAAIGNQTGGAVTLAAAALFSGGLAAYLARHARFLARLGEARVTLDRGDPAGARALLAPLLARYPTLPLVEKASAEVLYASGDPLSAASLYERAARRRRGDREIAVGLVASYAALNKAGDARRAAALAPDDVDVRLALAWSELVALGGDRARGCDIAEELSSHAYRSRIKDGAAIAMLATLYALAAARRGYPAAARSLLLEIGSPRPLGPHNKAFIVYLRGVTFREIGDRDQALAEFGRAVEIAPDTIGGALARREHANLAGYIPAPGSSSGQPSTDSSSSA